MDYYIYIHRNKKTNEVFYVGMGRGNRHLQTSGRSRFWINMYKKYGRNSEIVISGLTESRAKMAERLLIKYYGKRVDGTGQLVNISDGGDNVWNRGLPTEMQGMFGKKQSDKQKQTASDNMIKNNPMKRDDIREKVSKSNSKPWDINRFKKIVVEKDGIVIGEYPGLKGVCEQLGLKYKSVVAVVTGKRKTLMGLKIYYI